MEEKMQALPCFEINPILLEDRKKYIYGVNRASGKLFLQLCSLGIEIDGFIETGENCGMVFRKPVFQEDEIESEDAQVLVSQEGVVVKNGVYCNAPVVLNGEINIANIVIYGAGIVGQKLKRYLEDLDIHVRFFVDSDKRKNGISIDNLKVYGREVLRELSSDTTVIVAGKSWREMNEYLVQNNIQVKRFYESGNNILSQEDFVVVDAEKEIYLDGNSIVSLNEHYGDRRIIVYGVDCQTSCKIARCLSVFGFENICVAYDEDGAEEKTGFGSLISIYDILYTEDAYVVLLQDLEKEERLLELGLQKKKDYLFINECDIANRRVMHFDLNLGYIYDTGEDFDLYPGMYIYGKNKTEGYKIAVLGGSTTDGGLYSFASWSEILHQKYLKDDVTIYNCGMCGYSSGQELIKLMRDVALLEPNLVLVYSGYNDVLQKRKHTSAFEVPYFAESLNRMQIHVEKNVGKRVVIGKHNSKSAWEKWLQNIKYMHAVATLNNAEFFAFTQPLLPSKKGHTTHEKNILNSVKVLREAEIFDRCLELRSNAKKMEQSYDYIWDLSDIFDYEDVYMDIGHVYERGNKIIADTIWEKIKDKIPNEYKRG